MAVLAFAPVMNVLPTHNSWFGVRYVAHAGIGLAMVCGWICERLWDRFPARHRMLSVWLGCWLFGAIAVSNINNWHWRANIPLFTQMVNHRQPMMHAFLATNLFKAGRYAEAEQHARATIAFIEQGGKVEDIRANVYVILGMTMMHQGKVEEAVGVWKTALQRDPASVDAALNLGYFYDAQFEKTKEAKAFQLADQYYARAARGLTENAEVALVNRGLLWVQYRDLDQGIQIWKDGLKRFPGSADLKRNLQTALAQQEKRAKQRQGGLTSK